MGKKYSNGIVSPKGFDMSAAEPADQREVVQFYTDLISLGKCYPGIEVKVEEEQYAKYRLLALPSSTLSNWTKVESGIGPVGPAGQDGQKGDDGDSAYQVYRNNGGLLSEADWLASLKGEPGLDGDAGPAGPEGPIGPVGPAGSGATTFLELTDVPDTYSGQGSKVVTVKTDGSGLEFSDLNVSRYGANYTYNEATELDNTYVDALNRSQLIPEMNDAALGGAHSSIYIKDVERWFIFLRTSTAKIIVVDDINNLSAYTVVDASAGSYAGGIEKASYDPINKRILFTISDGTYAQTNTIVKAIDITTLAVTVLINYNTGVNPGAAVVEVVGNYIYTAEGNYAPKVNKFNLDGTFVSSISTTLGNYGAHGITSDGKFLYISTFINYYSNQKVMRVDLSTFTVTQVVTITIPGNPVPANGLGIFTNQVNVVGDYLYCATEGFTNNFVYRFDKNNLASYTALDVLKADPASNLFFSGVFKDKLYYGGSLDTFGSIDLQTGVNTLYDNPFPFSVNEFATNGELILFTGFDVYPVNNTGFIGVGRYFNTLKVKTFTNIVATYLAGSLFSDQTIAQIDAATDAKTLVTKEWVQANSSTGDFLPLAGGIMSGTIDLNENGLENVGWIRNESYTGYDVSAAELYVGEQASFYDTNFTTIQMTMPNSTGSGRSIALFGNAGTPYFVFDSGTQFHTKLRNDWRFDRTIANIDAADAKSLITKEWAASKYSLTTHTHPYLANVEEDLTPTLGGPLDLNYNALTKGVTIQALSVNLGYSGVGGGINIYNAAGEQTIYGHEGLWNSNPTPYILNLNVEYNRTLAQIDAAPVHSLVNKEWVLANAPSVDLTNYARTDIVETFDQDVNFSKSIKLPVTTVGGDGVIYKSNQRFLHTGGPDQEGIFDAGFPNLFLGKESGNFALTGDSNVAVGNYTMQGLTTGGQNTAVGGSSMMSITTGSYNMAVGSNTLAFLQDGQDNVAMGKNALQNITTGYGNLAIGRNAGYWYNNGATFDLTNGGTNNIFIGIQAVPNVNSPTNQIVIGSGTIGKGDNTTIIGGANTTDTYVQGLVHTNKTTAEITASADPKTLVTKEWVSSQLVTPALVKLSDGIVVEGQVRTDKGDPGFNSLDLSFNGAAYQGFVPPYGATGDYSFASGFNVQSSGYGAFVLGEVSRMSGTYAFGVGYNNINAGYSSVSIGTFNTVAAGSDYTFVTGNTNSSFGDGQFLAGLGNTLPAGGSTLGYAALGTANQYKAGAVLTVGNGSVTGNGDGSLNVGTRSNAIEVYTAGNIVAPSATIANITAEATGKVLTTKEWTESKYSLLAHTHTIANVTGLQTALDGKVNSFISSITKTANYSTANNNLETNTTLVFTAGSTITLSSTGLTTGFKQQVFNDSGSDITISSAETIKGANSALASGYYATYEYKGASTWLIAVGGAQSATGTVTSVTAGDGMTQTGTSTINPTLNIVSHAGAAGTIGTINIGADAIGVNLGTTSTTAAAGNHTHTSVVGLQLSGANTTYADAASPINISVTAGLSCTKGGNTYNFNTAGLKRQLAIMSDITTTSAYTPLRSADLNEALNLFYKVNSATAVTVTLNADNIGTGSGKVEITFMQYGAGQVTFAAGSGVTIKSAETLKTRKQNSLVTAIWVTDTEIVLTGDLQLL